MSEAVRQGRHRLGEPRPPPIWAPAVLGRRAPHPVLGARAGVVAQAGRGASPEDRRGPNRRRAGLTESMAPLPDSLRGGRTTQRGPLWPGPCSFIIFDLL